MICPRCHRDSTPGRRMPGDPPIYCTLGPFGWPCGEQLLKRPPTPKAPVLEKHVMARAKTWLAMQPGIFYERVNVARFGPDGGRQYQTARKGSADLHVTVNGRALYVELKRPGGKQRPEQLRYQRQVEAAGCVYVIEDSLGLETLKAAVENLRTSKAGT